MKILVNSLIFLLILESSLGLGASPIPTKVKVLNPKGKSDFPEVIKEYENKGQIRIDFQEGFKKTKVLVKMEEKKIFYGQINTDDVTALAEFINVKIRDKSRFVVEIDERIFSFTINPKYGRFIEINYRGSQIIVQQSPHPPFYD